MLKNQIRKSLFEQGLALSNRAVQENNKKIQKRVIDNFELSLMKNILMYFPFRQEIEVNLLSEELKKFSNEIYMPKLLSNKKMVFNRFVEDQNLTKNNYGILESDSEVYLEPIKFDVMFIPFVGVDLNGFRLGYGGGYFDRALSNIDHHKEKPLVIGLGYEYQLLDADFGEPHDLRYNKVVTENRIHIFN